MGVTSLVGLGWNLNERRCVDAVHYNSFIQTSAPPSSERSIHIKLHPNVFAVGIGYRF